MTWSLARLEGRVGPAGEAGEVGYDADDRGGRWLSGVDFACLAVCLCVVEDGQCRLLSAGTKRAEAESVQT